MTFRAKRFGAGLIVVMILFGLTATAFYIPAAVACCGPGNRGGK